MSYRNIYYDNKKSIIHHWGYDASGNPNKIEVEYKPFLYLPAANEAERDAYGIDGIPLVKKHFDNIYERNKFVDRCQTGIYFNLPVPQQYLLEKYHSVDVTELTRHPLRTFFFDIEVIADEFPDPIDARFPITSLTIYDTATAKFHVWGVKKYDEYSCKDHLTGIEPEEINYTYCVDEEELLKLLVRFWRRNFPDVIVGYNSYSFDIPYIVNRLTQVFGPTAKDKLSPVGSVYGVEKTNRFMQKYTEYTMGGITHIDYMVLYKYFTPGERESDSLDFTCYSELGMGKLEYGDTSLQELSEKHWDRFINYNIWDVKLMMMLDEAKNYLEVAKFTAFSGFCNLDKAFGKTAVITGVLAKQALDNGQIISTQKGTDTHAKIPGGYVKIPVTGLHEDIVSFDANSLYPSNIITLNISPETKVAKIIDKTEDDVVLFLFKERRKVNVPKEKLYPLLRKKNWSIAPNHIIYDQTTKGIAPMFCDTLYSKRKAVKEEMLKLETRLRNITKGSAEYTTLKAQSSKLDVEQYLYKILLNSTYGAFANRFFALYDLDCATSITTSGQALIKQTELIVNDILVSEYGLEPADHVVGMDTDSVASDSILRTNIGTLSVEDLFNICAADTPPFNFKNHEVIDVSGTIQSMTYNSSMQKAELGDVNYLIRHKVRKKKYKITSASGKEVIVTDDHSCMVLRDGNLIEIKPSHINTVTDKLVTIETCVNTDMNVIIEQISSVECVGEFDDEYVYDLEMSSTTDHTFFADDILVHNSVLVSMRDVCDKMGITLYDDSGELTPEFYELETLVSDKLNTRIKQWAIDEFNSADPRYFFKRESVCSKAIWTGKKNYVLYIVDKEGKKVNNFKYSGVQLAKSTLSNAVKDISKEIVAIIMFNKDKKRADDMIFDAYENKFMKLDLNDVAQRGNIKCLNSWDRKNRGLDTATGTPFRAKLSIYHNELLKSLGLQNKYRKIENGSKIKTIYLKPNRFNITGIAYQDTLPEDFDLQPDYETMFFKEIIKSLTPFYEALKWKIPDPKIQHQDSLEDVFG